MDVQVKNKTEFYRKSDKVKNFFDKEEKYLRSNFNIKLRKEIVYDLLKGENFKSILDAACGNGIISIQFLDGNTDLVLLDISEGMLNVAKSKIPLNYYKDVKIIQNDFLNQDFENQTFDVIICLGLLAHVNDPFKTILKAAALLKDHGILILQNSASDHLYSYLIRIVGQLKNAIRRNPYDYNFNKISSRELCDLFEENSLKIIKLYRYNQSFLFFSRIFPAMVKFYLVKLIFGTANHNRNKCLGAEYIYLLRKNA